MIVSGWVNIKASESLAAELDIAFPKRDHTSDGTIGDAAHAATNSDHNPDEGSAALRDRDADSIPEVHARDIDADLNRPGWTLERVFEIIRQRCFYGQEKRLQYMIVNGKITSRSWNWSWRPYGGVDPHVKHGHVSFQYGSGGTTANPENIVGPWGILAAVRAEEQAKMTVNAEASELLSADGIIVNPPWRKDAPASGGTNTHVSAKTALYEAMDQAHTAAARVEAARITLADMSRLVREITADPANMVAPELHPVVRAVRYALAHPA